MSTPEPTAAENAAPPAEAADHTPGETADETPDETPAAEPVQNRASRRAKPVKQTEPAHVGPRGNGRGRG